MRRRALALLAFLAVGCPGPAPPPPPQPVAPAVDRLNVLLLTIDTLRADHLGHYGYGRATSKHLDAFAAEAVVFEQAYSYWPKTRGSFVAMLTGRRDSQTGYGKTHPVLLEFNPTLAGVLRDAGYVTAAVVENGNLAREHGYAKGFDAYRETFKEGALESEMDRAKAITRAGVEFLRGAPRGRPFLLWLHYVNPHAPYAPPPPYDTAFLDAAAASGPRLPSVPGFHGGIPKAWAVPGRDRLGYYVAQYDGEIATVDREAGEVLDALRTTGLAPRTMVVITSDHGESLGEHDYYFDHGEDLFDPSLRVPLLIAVPGARRGARAAELASSLDVVPTVLDAVKVSYPPGLAGRSLLPALRGEPAPPPVRERLEARNDRNLSAVLDARFKLVSTPTDQGPPRLALYDRAADAAESRDLARARPAEARVFRRELELFLERFDREWGQTRTILGSPAPAVRLSQETCANLKALGYVVAGCQS